MKNWSFQQVRIFQHRLLFAFIGVLGILGAPRDKAWANDIAYRETVYNTDFTSAGVGGMRNSQSAVITLRGISGTVDKAYLYWAGPMNTTDLLASATIRLNGQPVAGQNIGLSDDNCWGYDVSQAYRADITAHVQAERNGDYLLSDYLHQGTNINANGASILVFFTDSNTNNNRDIVIFDGNDSNAQNAYDALGWNITLSGINYTNGQAFIQAHVSDGQVYPDDAVVLNGRILEPAGNVFQGRSVPSANDGPMGYGSLWDIFTWDVTSVMVPGLNTLNLTHGYIGHDCVSLIVAAINLPMGSAPPPPPTNQPPVVTGTPLITLHSPDPVVVTAQVLDADGDPLTYRISIDNEQVLSGSLPAGTPTTTGTLLFTNAFPLGDSTVVFTANDGRDSSSFTMTIRVVDDQPPILHLPANIVVPADPGKNTAVVSYNVTADDDFPGVVVVSLPASGSEFPIGITTVSVTAIDTSGHRTQGSFTVTVTDSTPPTIECPPDILQATDPGTNNAVVRYSVSAADNAQQTPALACQPPSGSVFPIGITTVVCQARDTTGNTATCMFTVTIVDRQPPVITLPGPVITGNDLHQCSAVVRYSVSVSDNAAGAAVICNPPSESTFLVGETTVVCIAADTSMNKATNSFTVTVQDRENPIINQPPNLTVPAELGKATAVVTFNVTASDNCSLVSVVCTPPSGSTFPIGTTSVTCLATDAAGNMATTSFDVVVVDTQPPVITVPNNITVTNDPGKYSAVVNFTVTIEDNQPGATVIVTPPSGSTFPVGTTTVIAIGTDAAGNKATNSFTVTVVDTEKPVLQLPNDIVITLPPGDSNAVVTYTVTATDNGPTVDVVTTPPSGSTFGVGVTIVTNIATDSSGNSTTGTFTVTVLDSEPPLIITPTNLIVAADVTQCSAVVTYTVTLRDNAPGASVVCTPPSGSTFALGDTTVLCLATDAASNLASNSFTVTVVDREKPALQLPADITVTVTAGQAGAPVTYQANATDICSTPTVACVPASGSVFPLGATVVQCTATDTAGNSASGGFTVTVVGPNNGGDIQPPVINGATNIIVGTDLNQCSAVVNYTTTVGDNEPGAVAVCTPPSGSTFPKGVTPVVCIATDAVANKTTNSFNVTVEDRELPTLQLPTNLQVTIPGTVSSAVVTYQVTATDNCSSPMVVCLPPSGASFPLGVTPVECSAIDADGNTTNGTFTVTVSISNNGDTQPPVINGATNRIVSTDFNQCSAVVNFTVTVTDNQPGAVVVCNPPSGSTFAKGITPVVCIATDAAANKATNSFNVTVVDRETPSLQLPTDIHVTLSGSDSSAVVTFQAGATDNCSTPVVVCTPPSGSTFPLGVTPVQCVATDGDGNNTNGTFTVTISGPNNGGDTQPPVINGATNRIVSTDFSQCSAVVNYTVTVSDNQPGAIVVCTPPSGATFAKGVTPVVCVATDAAANKATNSFNVTVVDRETPSLQLPTDIHVTLTGSDSNVVVTFQAGAIDNCSTPVVVCTPPSGSTFLLGVTPVQCVATDGDGNSTNGTFTVTISGPNNGGDTQPPVINGATNRLVSTDFSQCSAVVNYTVTVSDNQPGAIVVCTPPSGSTFAKGVTPVVCIATDAAANKATNSFTVTVVDQETPSLQLPTDIHVTLTGSDSNAVVTFQAGAIDNCSTPVVVCTPPSGSTFLLGVTPVQCVATDSDGNNTNGTFTVTISGPNNGGDAQPPVINGATNRIVFTDFSQCSAVVSYTVTVSDNQPGAIVVCTPPSGSTFAKGVTPVLCVATDAAANKATNSFTVTVVDQETPSLQLPTDIHVTLTGSDSNAVVTFQAGATDNCSTPVVVCTPPSGSTFALGVTPVQCVATDGDGNNTNGTFTVTISGPNNGGDTQPPVINGATNRLVSTDFSQCSAVVNYTVTVSDNQPGAVVVCTPPSGSTFAKGITPVVCIATDTAANKATNTFTVTVVDHESPSLQLPTDIHVTLTGSDSNAVVTFQAGALDNCSTAAVVCTPPSGSTFPLGVTPVQCVATDADGNSTNGTFTVTISGPNNGGDTQPPVINGATNRLVSTDFSQCSAVVNYTVTVSDNQPGAIVVCTPPSGSTFAKGVTPVVCIATDAAANKATNSFTVTVVDQELPALQLPTDIHVTLSASDSNAVVTFQAGATDNCSTPAVVCAPPSGSTFPLGVTPVQCVAIDGDGNSTNGTFTVTISGPNNGGDTQPPVINGATNRLVSTDLSQCSAVVTYTVTVTDNQPGALVVCTPPSGSTFAKGVTPVVCIATDASANKATNSFTVTVVDDEMPSLQLPTEIQIILTGSETNAVATFQAGATDNCSIPVVVCTPPSGSAFPLGVTPVQCVATDGDGNSTNGTFNVIISPPNNGGDHQPPVINDATNRIVATDLSQCSAVVNYTVTVSDNQPGAAVVCTPASGSTFAKGVTLVVCIATDSAANKATNSFTVTVVDLESPSLQLPTDIHVTLTGSESSAVVTFQAGATDNCSTPVVVCTPPSGSSFPLGATPVQCVATDGDGNNTNGTFTVTISGPNNGGDTQPPVITGATNRIVATDLSQCSAVVNYTVTVSDNQAGSAVVCTPPPGSTFAKGVTPVVCIATDAAANKATNSFTVTVVDLESPSLQLPTDIQVTLTGSESSAVVTFQAGATDNCSSPVVICTPPSGSTFSLGVTPVQCTATDADGNNTNGTFTVTISGPNNGGDTQPPVITGATNRIVATDLGQCSAVVNYTVAVSDDKPGAVVVCTPPSGSTFAKGVTPVVCIATDAAANKATNSFTVTVVDREAPSLQLPTDIHVTLSGSQSNAVVTFQAGATDNCSTPVVVCTPPSGSTFPLGTTPVQCVATDTDGNSANGTFNISVSNNGSDTQPPIIITGTNNVIVVSDINQCSATVDYFVTVSDDQPGATVSCVPPPGSIFPKGVTTVVCVATDAAANKSTNSFVVTVLDRELPTLQLPANITVTIATNESSAVVNFNATATDNCSVPTVVCTPASGSTFPLGTTPVTCAATDADGNAASGSFTVTVQRYRDTQPPVVISIEPSKRLLWPPNHKMVHIKLNVQAVDDSGAPVTSRIISVTSSEPENGLGDGDTDIDWVITGNLTVNLRAERRGVGAGRVYTITVECKDAAGNITLVTTTAIVPHDMGRPNLYGKQRY